MIFKDYRNISDLWRDTIFMKSERMSSYLVAFIVFDFVYKENVIEPAGIPVSIFLLSIGN